MVLLSPYKIHRVLGRDTLMNAAIYHRDRAMYYVARPWASGYMYFISDARAVIFYVCLIYLAQRVMNGRTVDEDALQTGTIRRWGNSVENVRKQLSPADQVRVRLNLQAETYMGVFLPNWYKQKPDGLPWPVVESHH